MCPEGFTEVPLFTRIETDAQLTVSACEETVSRSFLPNAAWTKGAYAEGLNSDHNQPIFSSFSDVQKALELTRSQILMEIISSSDSFFVSPRVKPIRIQFQMWTPWPFWPRAWNRMKWIEQDGICITNTQIMSVRDEDMWYRFRTDMETPPLKSVDINNNKTNKNQTVSNSGVRIEHGGLQTAHKRCESWTHRGRSLSNPIGWTPFLLCISAAWARSRITSRVWQSAPSVTPHNISDVWKNSIKTPDCHSRLILPTLKLGQLMNEITASSISSDLK